MKATTVAAAAALLGSVRADGWESWSSESSDPKTTPVADTTTAKAETSTWSEWSTTSTPVKETSTDPSTWSEWSTSSTSVKPTSTEPATTWSEWSSSSTSVKPTSTDPSTWSAWSSTSSTPSEKTTTSKSSTWSEWSSSSTPVAATTSPSETWSEWEPTATLTSTSTKWITVTVWNNEASTWSEWTTTESKTVVASSTTTMTSSWAGWSSVPVADASCQMQVSLSYGPAVWYPTPVIATAENTTSWAEWESATSSTPAKVTSTPSSSWSVWESSSTPAKVTSTPSSSWSAWEGSSTPVKVSSTSSASSSSQTWGSWGGNGGISSNGNKFGMTYSPYTSTSECKDQGTVSYDIAQIAAKGFTSVRVYSTDCNTLEYVGNAAREHGIKVILGVFISETGISGAQPQVEAIAKWAQWDLVELIVVGNEAVFQGRCSAGDLAVFISASKQTFKAAGFNGAVSTTDELSIWQSQGSAWCDVVDVVTANLYAFFNPETKAEDAGSFIQAEIDDLSKVCPGKEVYVMESGWPSAGECNGAACPSPENQAVAIKGIQSAVGAKVVFFSYEDEQWKQPGQFGVEQHWGCANVFN